MRKIIVRLDNNEAQFDYGCKVYEVCKELGVNSNKAIGAIYNDQHLELNSPLLSDGVLKLLSKEDEIALKFLNHTAAHITAQAIKRLYPNVNLGIGPAIEYGFYYDIDFKDYKFSADELSKVEDEIKKIVKENLKLEREEITYEKALELFASDIYKLELINNYKDEIITIYRQGEFVDLCRGGHVKETGLVKHLKLTSIAGAYWRGDSKNKQLTRIYGASFFEKEDLEEYLLMLEERKLRDHRKLGKELEIFMVNQDVGVGLPFWLPNGATIRRVIERYITDKEIELGYQHVYTPILANISLYQKSGHWDHYQDSMFPPMDLGDGEKLVLRPMNCPHHMMIYKNDIHSYRELPIRIAELGMMHRYEKSGAVTGLQRVREMTLNDAHCFVRPDQVKDEFKRTLNLMFAVFKDFKIENYTFRLSYRDPLNTEKYFNDDKMWEYAQKVLKEAMDELGLKYIEAIGEAAFYGPKLDVQVKTAIGSDETLSTIQLDFLLPEKFDLTYVGEDGKNNHRPVVIHRGIVSTMERFIAYLIEEYKGAFPVWLAPLQVKIIPVNNDVHALYCEEIIKILQGYGIRVSADYRDEKLSYRMREAIISKIPFQVVIGDNEMQNDLVTYRTYQDSTNKTIAKNDFLELLLNDITKKI